MNRTQAAATLEEIRTIMARAGEFRHLSGWASIINGVLVLAGCAVSKWVVGVSFYPYNDVLRLAAVWGPVAAAGLAVDLVFTLALARRSGKPAWSPSAKQFVAGLLPGVYAGGVLTIYLVGEGTYDALPGVWMVCYGAAVMGASLFTPWEVRYFGLAHLLLGSVALMFFREQAMWAMALGFGVLHLLFGAFVLRRYPSGERPAPGASPAGPEEDGPGPEEGDDGDGDPDLSFAPALLESRWE